MPSRNPRALPPDLDPQAVPDHVAIVMDGNGRWAGAKGLPRNKGHEAGEAALFDTVEGGLDAGLSWLTVYAFSTENWRRPASEVRFLMNFNESLLVRRSHELHEREVRIRFIGRRDRIPPHVRRRIGDCLQRRLQIRLCGAQQVAQVLIPVVVLDQEQGVGEVRLVVGHRGVRDLQHEQEVAGLNRTVLCALDPIPVGEPAALEGKAKLL